jgi:integrase/recombinase XerD
MTELRGRMIEDMQLHGCAEKTQQAYLTAVRGLAKYYRRSPEELSAEEIRQFFLSLVNDKAVASGTLTIYLCGIKFFYERTLEREWTIFDLLRPKKRKKLPVVLSVYEVRFLLSLVAQQHNPKSPNSFTPRFSSTQAFVLASLKKTLNS